MADASILVHRDGPVLWITLNRPARLNALNPALLEAFGEAFEQIDGAVRAVVIRGAGRAFSSGHDLKQAAEEDAAGPKTAEDHAAAAERLHEITRRIRACPVPVVCQVHGYAIGGGAEIALSGDLVVAARSTTFRFTETAVGLVVTNGFTAVLPHTAGSVIAKEIILLGEPFDAARAMAWQLINRVVDDDELEAEVERVVGLLLDKAPTALRLAKRLIDEGLHGTQEDAMARETAAGVIAASSGDAREAATAFREGRPPAFTRRSPS